MAYKPRDERTGYHHVVTRGNNKRVIYESEHDRWYFCSHVSRVAAKNDWRILAFALMSNHYHLVIHVGGKGLAAGMCELNTGYALWFNQKRGRINHLFGKRYWNRRLRTDSEVMAAVRYVVQNPQRAGLPGALEGFVWTSYAATIGLAFARMRLERDELLGFFGESPRRAVESFRDFCSVLPASARVRWQPP